MSRMLLRPSCLLLALLTIVLVKTSSFSPTNLNADEPSEFCADAADTVADATSLLIEQQQLLALSVADEEAAAEAYSECESATPGMCGDEEAYWEMSVELVQFGVGEVATASAELETAQQVYVDCQNGGGGEE